MATTPTATLGSAVAYFQTIPGEVLAAIISGEIDAAAVAAHELASRGLGERGQWIGFKKAAEIHAETIARQPAVTTALK